MNYIFLGNEGKGLSTEIQNLCTKYLTIPAQRNSKLSELDSLNVSVATGLLNTCRISFNVFKYKSLESVLFSRNHTAFSAVESLADV
jgi:tRNA(Leu) C34 or U34 (ribose-2'-O)-methylase TrmL